VAYKGFRERRDQKEMSEKMGMMEPKVSREFKESKGSRVRSGLAFIGMRSPPTVSWITLIT